MLKHTDPACAAAELIKRRSVRSSLSEWARHRGFEPAPHHQLIISEIETFLDSEDEVLLLFAPPGSAKSTYVSVLLPSWYLAHNPTHSILAATHSVEFAERWGRRVRNDIAQDANVLGVSLSEDSKAAARWSLATGGEYYGVRAGVGISGFRANLGVGDDLFGSREDAYSDTVRNAVVPIHRRASSSIRSRQHPAPKARGPHPLASRCPGQNVPARSMAPPLENVSDRHVTRRKRRIVLAKPLRSN